MKVRISTFTIILISLMFISSLKNELVYAATKPAKVSNNSIVTTSIGYYSLNLKWKKAKAAKKYKVAYRYSNKYAWRYSTVSSTSAKLNNLKPNVSYTVKIQSLNGTKKSAWTSGKSFKTKKSPYIKTFNPSAKTNKHLIGVVEGGWITVNTNTHIKEYYKYDNGYKKFGYRCYGVTFSSPNDKSLLNELNCNMGVVVHNRPSSTVKCNSFSCIHDHIYGNRAFVKPERDSTTVVSHKIGSKGSISLGYSISGTVLMPVSKAVKFTGVTK